MNTTIKSFYVAGVQFRPSSIIEALGSGEKIKFVYEPENKHDNNAIRVECLFEREVEVEGDGIDPSTGNEKSWELIGYVPKGETWLFHILRVCKIPLLLKLDVNPAAPSHKMLLVTVAIDVEDPTIPFI